MLRDLLHGGVGCDLELRRLHLFLLLGADGPDEQADQEEGTGGQQQEAVGHVPAAGTHNRQDLDAEQLAGAEQLPHERHRDEDEAVAEAVADTVEEARDRWVLHGECLGATHHDAVGDDKADEHRQLLADVIGHRLDDLIHHDHQGGDDGHLHDDADAAGDMVADQRHEQVGEGGYQGQRNAHHQGHLHAGGDRQGRADTENLQGDGVVIENGFDDDILDFHGDQASPDFRLDRNWAKPRSPIQNLIRLSMPRVVRVAPDRPSTWWPASGRVSSTVPLITVSWTSPSSPYSALPGHFAFH